MKKLTILYTFMLCLFFVNSQSIINTPSINKYANVVILDYCKNTIEVPAGMGGQFAIGDKILLIQMKGASLLEGNNANNGKVDDYNNAGNYEINEIRSINSGANDVIVFEYEIEREYNVSGFVQIVNIPQYEDVVIQNTLTCQAWNGSFGGILAFNATGTITLNADIDVSGKGFRGADGTTLLAGNQCYNFGGNSYAGYDCDVTDNCGAKKGEGVGDRYLQNRLGRGVNANGGGGGNDHNAGGGGGGCYARGGIGGERTNGTCQGFGGIGGDSLAVSSIENKIFLAGAGGAGDANNGTINSFVGTSGANAGGMIFITSNSLISNGNSILSNGDNVIDTVQGDGAGGGGAGGMIILDIDDYVDLLNVENIGGAGGNVEDDNACPGPGGGGSGGLLWLSQMSVPNNISLNAIGGASGVLTILPCVGSSNGAVAGENGGFYFDFPSYVSDVVFEQLSLVAGSDTVICGEGTAPLWSEASGSKAFDFVWTWSSGTETANDFNFDPEFSDSYNVVASATYNIYDQTCEEIYIVKVDIRKPNINIVASSFFGDTVKAGEPVFLNAVVTPLNPNYIYEWTPADRVDPNDDRNTTALPAETESYCLKVTDEIGCSNTECVDVLVFEPSIISPNAFSPNGDDLNDSYMPILSEDLEIISFKIYDRWGDLVYQTKENKAWDGTKNGKELPLEMYIWNLKVRQTLSKRVFEQQGEVYIVR